MKNDKPRPWSNCSPGEVIKLRAGEQFYLAPSMTHDGNVDLNDAFIRVIVPPEGTIGVVIAAGKWIRPSPYAPLLFAYIRVGSYEGWA